VRTSAGSVESIPTDACVAVAGTKAVVVRVGDQVVAFENRCLHQETPLAGGTVRNGVLICPAHFWRYRLPVGRHIGTGAQLPTYPVEIVDGEAWVDVPDPEPPKSMRERLLEHARTWEAGR
jgi:nitrite reductase/ring-hydroxylating ferredoxin subunit